ncbi:tRNA nucleotidyltransferase (CCA-adding enzyme) [Paraburkholderia unamae]|nr:HD domain-containing protein [Paraburkholderia unamae]RAR55334.1 tRNA nucleotidyltransferase (CCA-adding enzyme) [Paraburkholderia unamae]CAG9267806.1 tRNA nucleotidyltransferase (CCA-adding enzyme) [Paraburkholderia unamae]
MVTAVQMDAVERLTPRQRGQVLGRALMAPRPVGFFLALRDCAGLRRLLPEFDALFGVPMITDAPEAVDAGEHQLRVLAETARRGAPLAVRVAALLHKIGMGRTPPERWAGHPGHEVPGAALLSSLASRIEFPPDALDLALLAIAEADCVHRASDMRAAAMASLLERVCADTRTARFEQLLLVCVCDYAAYPGHIDEDYVKVKRLRRALAAYCSVNQATDPGALLEARARAIARSVSRPRERDAG